ncbi:hypothetical protein [Microcystis sp. BLCC-F210]|uniref:hypothetical protein n=1 Tax=Microcystis sp. BLCC-F210 TaxID=3342751 RepID=UPI0035C90B52
MNYELGSGEVGKWGSGEVGKWGKLSHHSITRSAVRLSVRVSEPVELLSSRRSLTVEA